VRVTHPFHPLSGQELVCVGERYNRYGTRLLLRVDDDHLCSVPRQWTDVVGPEPEVVIGEGRALFRATDLLELADLVSRLVEEKRRLPRRKANNAATVRETTPPANSRRETGATESSLAANWRTVSELDSDQIGGVIVETPRPEVACQGEPTPKNPRRQRSARRAR
jgi:hypothetical protein